MNGRKVLEFDGSNLAGLVQEYAGMRSENDDPNWEVVEAKLIDDHDWTPDAAEMLTRLVRRHGSFTLRNAAGLALACQHEDGDDGW